MQYDVIPFVDEHIISKIKEYIDFKATQMQEKNETEKQILSANRECKVDKKDVPKEVPHKNCVLDEPLQKDITVTDVDDASDSEQNVDSIILNISVTVPSNRVVGHPPPFTPEEYKKIRYVESTEQGDVLKTRYGSDLYEDWYTCGEILNFGEHDIDYLRLIVLNIVYKYTRPPTCVMH